jgi:uncharacterized membrane protein YphA (DoxX/SURF4 family)
MKEIMKTILWVILAIFFLMAGGAKLLNPDAHAQDFTNWGYPLWFLYVTGIVEVGGAIGLLIPATRFYSTLVLMATIMGAAVTHLRAGEIGAVPVPLVLLALLILLTWTLRSSQKSSPNPSI